MRKIIDKIYGECYNCEELTTVYLAQNVESRVKYGEWLCRDCLKTRIRHYIDSKKLSTP